MAETHIPVSTLRQDLKNAQEHFGRVRAYHTALALQKARRALENFFDHERSFFLLLFGDGRSDPNHRPPTSWRVIDGGKV